MTEGNEPYDSHTADWQPATCVEGGALRSFFSAANVLPGGSWAARPARMRKSYVFAGRGLARPDLADAGKVSHWRTGMQGREPRLPQRHAGEAVVNAIAQPGFAGHIHNP